MPRGRPKKVKLDQPKPIQAPFKRIPKQKDYKKVEVHCAGFLDDYFTMCDELSNEVVNVWSFKDFSKRRYPGMACKACLKKYNLLLLYKED